MSCIGSRGNCCTVADSRRPRQSISSFFVHLCFKAIMVGQKTVSMNMKKEELLKCLAKDSKVLEGLIGKKANIMSQIAAKQSRVRATKSFLARKGMTTEAIAKEIAKVNGLDAVSVSEAVADKPSTTSDDSSSTSSTTSSSEGSGTSIVKEGEKVADVKMSETPKIVCQDGEAMVDDAGGARSSLDSVPKVEVISMPVVEFIH